MLSPAGNIHSTSSRQATDEPPNGSARMSSGSDIRIIQHGVAKSADGSLRMRLSFGKNIDQPVPSEGIGDVADINPNALQ